MNTPADERHQASKPSTDHPIIQSLGNGKRTTHSTAEMASFAETHAWPIGMTAALLTRAPIWVGLAVISFFFMFDRSGTFSKPH